MCSSSDTWWHHQCRASCSKCSTSLPACTAAAPNETHDATCDSSCHDTKSAEECQNADAVWNMCSGSSAWWHSQCSATCALCPSGRPPCESQVACCADVKPSSECQIAEQSWQMCSTPNSWWHKQCKKTCGKCTNPTCTAPSLEAAASSCDLQCQNTKSDVECESANSSWAMCAQSSWFRTQCVRFCGICFSYLEACASKQSEVRGVLALTVETESAGMIENDIFVQLAVKDLIARMAGHGLDSSNVAEVKLALSSSRRLQEGSLRAEFVLQVPENLQDSVAFSINNRSIIQNINNTAVFSRFSSAGLQVVEVTALAESITSERSSSVTSSTLGTTMFPEQLASTSGQQVQVDAADAASRIRDCIVLCQLRLVLFSLLAYIA